MGAAAAPAALPDLAAKEILRQYADVLRVGRLHVNGAVVTWPTGSSLEGQLQCFSAVLHAALQQLPEADGLSDANLHQAAYWLCKALSINYALADVLDLVSRKAGAVCTIETGSGASVVDYGVMLRKVFHDSRASGRPRSFGHLLNASLYWKERDNIIYRDPETAARTVKGTISRLETEFPMPPMRGFTPKYTLQVEFQKSPLSQFMSRMVCSDVTCEPGIPNGGCGSSGGRNETLSLEPATPLYFDKDKEIGSDCGIQ